MEQDSTGPWFIHTLAFTCEKVKPVCTQGTMPPHSMGHWILREAAFAYGRPGQGKSVSVSSQGQLHMPCMAYLAVLPVQSSTGRNCREESKREPCLLYVWEVEGLSRISCSPESAGETLAGSHGVKILELRKTQKWALY